MESFEDAFRVVCQRCQDHGVTEVAYDTWIKDIKPLKYENGVVFLGASSEFKRNIIEEKYAKLLTTLFEEVMGFEVEVRIVTSEEFGEEKTSASSSISAPTPSPTDGEYEYTFDTFIVGPSNQFAHAASLSVATNPGGKYNPLFIYGGSGLGKTHLMKAIYSEYLKNHPNASGIMIKAEDFTNELIASLGNNTMQEFHNKYRTCDFLLVDDIQFIAGKEQTQEEFFHTFEALFSDGKQIVLTSDRLPKDIGTLEDRLRTRFEWGILADIQPPEFETRIAIIHRKAELLNFTISDEVCEFIASRLKTNIRQLEGTVKKLKAYKDLNTEPSIVLAQTVIKEIINDNQPVPVTIDRIVSEVARTFNVTPEDIRSKRKTAEISSARQVAIYVVREITQMPMASIGEFFGNRDHSTIVYTLQQVEEKRKTDYRYKETINDIIKNIRDS